jgi:hypothetical protein
LIQCTSCAFPMQLIISKEIKTLIAFMVQIIVKKIQI